MRRQFLRLFASLLVAVAILGGRALADDPPAAEAPAAKETAPAPTDAELQAQVRDLLKAIEGLENAQVSVKAGVVILEGEAGTTALVERAGELASKVGGVRAVENNLERPREVGKRLAPVWQRLRSMADEALSALPLFGIALLLVIAAWLLAKLVGRWSWLYRRISRNRFAQDIARQLLRAAIVVGGIILALEVLDATALVGAVLGTAGIVGLAIGFAFRDLFENYLASILLSVRQPFQPGDHVVIGEHEGKVLRLSTRATVLRTLDGNHLRLLNAEVYKSAILNYTTNPKRRFDFAVGLGTDVELTAARKLGLATLSAMDGIVDEPPPNAIVEELGDSSVLLRLYAWVDQREADFQKTRGEAIRLVKQAFEAHEFDMPEPIQRVRIERVQPGGTPAGVRAPTGTSEAEDIEPERHLDEEIAEERARSGGDDLLDAQEERAEPALVP